MGVATTNVLPLQLLALLPVLVTPSLITTARLDVSDTHSAEMCQAFPITYIGVGFEDGSSYYLGWTGSTPGEGQLVAYITDERDTLGGLCSPRLPKHMICFAGIGGGGLKIYNFFLNSSGLQEQHWLLISRFTPVVQAVSTTALSSNQQVNLMRGAGHGTSSARSESGEPLSQIPLMLRSHLSGGLTFIPISLLGISRFR